MKTRSRARSGQIVVDLASDSDSDVGEIDPSNRVGDKPADEHVKIGDVGYTFRKLFNNGWFEGKVVEIRHGAENGKNRRCEYEDGDTEDLSLSELKALAKNCTFQQGNSKAHEESYSQRGSTEPDLAEFYTLVKKESPNQNKASYSQRDITEPVIISPEKAESSNCKNQEFFDEEDWRADHRGYKIREYDDESPDCFEEEEQDIEPNGIVHKHGDVGDLSSTLKVQASKKRKKNSLIEGMSSANLKVPRKKKYTQKLAKQTAIPERIESSNKNSPDDFNDEDYNVLCLRYLTPRVREEAEIPGGMTLRRQTKSRIIDTPMYKKLKPKIDSLLKKNRRQEVYKIFCGLRNWEMNPVRAEVWRQVGEVNGDDVREYVDLTNDSEEQCIDVDRYISEILLVDIEDERVPDVVESGSTVSKIQVTADATDNIIEYIRRVIKTLAAEDLVQLEEVELSNVLPQELKKEQIVDSADRCSAGSQMIEQPIASNNTGAKADDATSLIEKDISQTANSSFDNSLDTPSRRISNDGTINMQLPKIKEQRTVCVDGTNLKAGCNADVKMPSYLSTQTKSAPCIPKLPPILKDEASKSSAKSLVMREQIHHQTLQEPKADNAEEGTNKSEAKTAADNESTQKGLEGPKPAVIVNQVATVKQTERNKKFTTKMRGKRSSMKPKVEPVDAKRDKRTFMLGNLLPPTPQLHPSHHTPYSPQLFSQLALSYDYAQVQSFAHIPYASAPKQHYKSARKRQYCNRSLAGNKATNKDRLGPEKTNLVPSYRTKQSELTLLLAGVNEGDDLAACWRNQNKRRRNGEWFPHGRLTGRWKAPEWAEGKQPKQQPPATCKKTLLPVLKNLLNKAISCSLSASASSSDEYFLLEPEHLTDIVCPFYVKPTLDALKNAHDAIQSLLPKGDCESFDVIRVARSYYDYWRPRRIKVILLAESHAFTEENLVLHGPRLDNTVIDTKRYDGPREFLSLVYNLSYGENEALTTNSLPSNPGTSQFWCLLAACARGVDYIPTVNNTSKQITSVFAADLLKGGGLPVQERLNAKLKILEDLREQGIWLLDCSIFGWYIPQQQKYKRSTVSNEIHRMAKERPPPYMKSPSLVLSFELFTKHLIREIAEEGHLQLVVPIGREVEQTITRDRLVDAVRIPGSDKTHARVVDAFPAPNAWIPGGYAPFYAKLAELIQSVAPKAGKVRVSRQTNDDSDQSNDAAGCTDSTFSSK